MSTIAESLQARRLKEKIETGKWPMKVKIPGDLFEELRRLAIITYHLSCDETLEIPNKDVLLDLQTTRTLATWKCKLSIRSFHQRQALTELSPII